MPTLALAALLALTATLAAAPVDAPDGGAAPTSTAAPTPTAAPPRFAADPDGRARNGQAVHDPARPRVQRLAILPDRTTGRDWGLPYLHAAVEDLNIVRPDAVFTVGDMVQGYTRSTRTWDSEADEYLRAVGGLTPAFYPTAGNHDVISGTRMPGDATFAQRYRERFGPLWYSVELDLATALVLFSDEGLGDGAMRFSDEQLSWLAGALDAAKARGKPIFLLMHRPMWRYPVVHWQDRVQPLLESAGVNAVIAGHFHAMQRDPDVGGVQYHIVGTCGGMIDQPPLAGQLQHLTFVDCTAEGALRVWHQPVGLVLPEDFIVRADQDRVLALREPQPAVRALGRVPDTAGAPASVEATARVAVRNPLDVPLHVTLDPPGMVRTADGHPLWWTPGRAGRGTPGARGGVNGWTSAVLEDIDNPRTMATNERAVTRCAPGACDRTVPPKGEMTVEIPVTLLPTAPDSLPPQLEVYVTFQDNRGRTVPVYLPTRLPVERLVPVGERTEDAARMPVLCWNYSPYDTGEENPWVRFARSADGNRLIVDVEVPDDVASAAPQWSAPDAKRMKDPHADAVRVLVDGTGAAPLDVLLEPFTPGCVPPDGVKASFERRAGTGWTARIDLPMPTGAEARVQVGVADNDDTFHTQWRWLAPEGAEGRWPLRTAHP